MTALSTYQKLECGGLWRDDPDARRREVTVSFGDATLIMSDPRSGTALAHWSLPAVQRQNPGTKPAIFGPGPDAVETLELDDPDMIAALDTVRTALARARPHPGRLRNALLGAATVGVLALGVFWLPDALVTHTASVATPSVRAEIGRVALADLTRVTGPVCAGRRGVQALAKLSDKLFGADAGVRLHIVRDGMRGSLRLPARQIVLSEALVAEQDGPQLLAGFALIEQLGRAATDPTIPLLEHAGLSATLRFLTSGTLPPASVAGYAETVLARTAPPLPQEAILERFRDAGVPTTPYAYAIDPSGESVLGLIEADPFSSNTPPPLLSDEDWLSLQDICGT